MSRYHGINNNNDQDSVITPRKFGDAAPITFRTQSKTEKSYNVRGGSAGTSAERMSEQNARNSYGDY